MATPESLGVHMCAECSPRNGCGHMPRLSKSPTACRNARVSLCKGVFGLAFVFGCSARVVDGNDATGATEVNGHSATSYAESTTPEGSADGSTDTLSVDLGVEIPPCED